MIAIAMQNGTYIVELLDDSTVFGPQWKKNSSVIMGISALLSMWVMNTSTTIMLLPIAVSVCYVICDTVKGISEKEQINLQVCVLLGIAVFLINWRNCYTNWDGTEWFFDSVFSQRKYRHRIY